MTAPGSSAGSPETRFGRRSVRTDDHAPVCASITTTSAGGRGPEAQGDSARRQLEDVGEPVHALREREGAERPALAIESPHEDPRAVCRDEDDPAVGEAEYPALRVALVERASRAPVAPSRRRRPPSSESTRRPSSAGARSVRATVRRSGPRRECEALVVAEPSLPRSPRSRPHPRASATRGPAPARPAPGPRPGIAPPRPGRSGEGSRSPRGDRPRRRATPRTRARRAASPPLGDRTTRVRQVSGGDDSSTTRVARTGRACRSNSSTAPPGRSSRRASAPPASRRPRRRCHAPPRAGRRPLRSGGRNAPVAVSIRTPVAGAARGRRSPAPRPSARWGRASHGLPRRSAGRGRAPSAGERGAASSPARSPPRRRSTSRGARGARRSGRPRPGPRSPRRRARASGARPTYAVRPCRLRRGRPGTERGHVPADRPQRRRAAGRSPRPARPSASGRPSR